VEERDQNTDGGREWAVEDVFNAHKLLYHSTLSSRVTKKKKKCRRVANPLQRCREDFGRLPEGALVVLVRDPRILGVWGFGVELFFSGEDRGESILLWGR
jgi:hypothetical protein